MGRRRGPARPPPELGWADQVRRASVRHRAQAAQRVKPVAVAALRDNAGTPRMKPPEASCPSEFEV